MASHLSPEGEEHSEQADERKLPPHERRCHQGDSSKKKEGHGEYVQRQVEAISVPSWVNRPLPGEQAKLISTIVLHEFPRTVLQRQRRVFQKWRAACFKD